MRSYDIGAFFMSKNRINRWIVDIKSELDRGGFEPGSGDPS